MGDVAGSPRSLLRGPENADMAIAEEQRKEDSLRDREETELIGDSVRLALGN